MAALKTEKPKKYGCGHNDKVVPLMNDDILEAYMNWGEIVAVGKEYSLCFECFYAQRGKRCLIS